MTEPASIDLFTPLRMGPYTLENRLVMAPMTRNRAGPGNVPTELNASYYAQRATAGLIITEATQVSPQGVGYPNTPGIHSPEQVAGWRRVTDAVHERGGIIFLQLWHAGRISHPSLQPDGALPIAPSALQPSGNAVTYEGLQPFVRPRALAAEDIPAVIEQFQAGAENARLAGFDGVEFHAANGYLIDQFLRDGSNHRTDRYGGSVENRARFLLELIEAVIPVWGPGRVGVRLSPQSAFNDMRDSDPAQLFGYVAERLNDYPLAYLHVIQVDENATGTEFQDLRPRFDFQRLRRLFKGIYMANGDFDRARAERALAQGEADLVAFGRLFLANPDLPERFRRNAKLNTWDRATFYGGDARGYTDYPTLDEEARRRV
ncbi:alkene reductase [Candidatus Methylocalor cossyra]|uniref:N-ethylmaleimide reductase n=1 Tax=Candidatus Methylocalor cossyra TaxID=3108543 RepID=A0ABP1C9I8_9GAMM